MSEAKINKDMMYWARKNAGYINGYEEDLPKYIKSHYTIWESGEKYPTWNQLREVSKKYKIPTAFFFMKNPPKTNKLPSLINYRTIDNTTIYENKSPYLIGQIRKSETRRNIYLDLSENLNKKIPSFNKYNGPINKKDFSKYIRNSIDVDLNKQKEWFKEKKHYDFLNNWKYNLNKKFGILIFETKDVDINEMRGLCIFHEITPIILLNGKDSVNGRIFSLFHELTHLLLGESAICGIDEEIENEIFCNTVAGEFLVPTYDLNTKLKNNTLNDELIEELSHIYGVSEYVILRRLLDTHKINKKEYNLKIQYLEDKYTLNSDKGGNYLNNMIKYNSREYYSLVLNAYDSGIINIVDFTKFTNLNKNLLPQLQNRIYGGK